MNITRMVSGKTIRFVSGTPAQVAHYAAQMGIAYDSLIEIEPTGFTDMFKIWGIGELADHLKEQQERAGETRP